MSERKVPKIRFPGFTDDWEQRKLLDCLIQPISDGPHETPNLVDEGIPFISVDAIVDNKINFERKRGYITEEYDLECRKKYSPQREDVYLVKSGSTVGKVAIVETDERFNIWSPLAAMRVNKEVLLPKYLYYFLQLDDIQDEISAKSRGGTQPNLSMRILEKFIVRLPDIDEQKKISDSLNQLDILITLHQQECDKWKELKKGMLQKMFPKEGESVPEIRFPGFTDSWEQRKLSSIYGNIRNAFVGTATPYYVPDGHFYLESNNVKDGQINRNTEVFINDEFYYRQKDKWLHTNDMVMVQSGHVGHAAVIPENLDKTAAHALIMFTDQIEETEPYFLNYQYQTATSIKKIADITKGNTIKHILSSDMQKFIVDMPSLEEQRDIASFFRRLDTLITLHQRECDKWQTLKKALLQQMFV